MESMVMLDHQRFGAFLQNEEVDATVVTRNDNLHFFDVNKIIEVWHKASTIRHREPYLAIVVENSGALVEPNVLRIRVRKIGNWN